jgi:hypothetical protein
MINDPPEGRGERRVLNEAIEHRPDWTVGTLHGFVDAESVKKHGARLRSVSLLPPGTAPAMRLPEINCDRATASDDYTMRAR